MSQLVMFRGVNSRKNLMNRFLSKFEFGPYFLLSSLLLFVVLITVITLVFSTRQVTKGYLLNSLDRDHNSLVKQMEVNDMKVSQVRSLNYIQNSDRVSIMSAPRSVVYVTGDNAIASK